MAIGIYEKRAGPALFQFMLALSLLALCLYQLVERLLAFRAPDAVGVEGVAV